MTTDGDSRWSRFFPSRYHSKIEATFCASDSLGDQLPNRNVWSSPGSSSSVRAPDGFPTDRWRYPALHLQRQSAVRFSAPPSAMRLDEVPFRCPSPSRTRPIKSRWNGNPSFDESHLRSSSRRPLRQISALTRFSGWADELRSPLSGYRNSADNPNSALSVIASPSITFNRSLESFFFHPQPA